ncbi:hypothetical protein GCM10027579_10860 [Calidifontibacter terrae]
MATAQAHEQLLSSVPAAGAQVSAPSEVTLTFSGPMIATGTAVRVIGPDGANASQGDAKVAAAAVTQPLRTPLVGGSYTVTWRAVSGDGHPVSGTFTFSVAANATAAPPTAGLPGISQSTAAPTAPTSSAPTSPTSSEVTPPAKQTPTTSTDNEPLLIGAAVVIALLLIGGGAAYARTRLRDDAPANGKNERNGHDSDSDSTD